MTGAFAANAFQNDAFQTDSAVPTAQAPTPGRRRRGSSQPIMARSVDGHGQVEFGFHIHATGTVEDDDIALALL